MTALRVQTPQDFGAESTLEVTVSFLSSYAYVLSRRGSTALPSSSDIADSDSQTSWRCRAKGMETSGTKIAVNYYSLIVVTSTQARSLRGNNDVLTE